MKFKADWTAYLHTLRQREVEMIFATCPPDCFGQGLELGAGDGYQSQQLARFVRQLLCTERNLKRFVPTPHVRVAYQVADARDLDRVVAPSSQNLVFSSNMLEHVGPRQEVLQKIHTVLKNDGVCINVVPNCFLKICWMLFFYPNLLVEFLEVMTTPGRISKIRRHFSRISKSGGEKSVGKGAFDNNPGQPAPGFFRRYIWPFPHGDYPSHAAEFVAYRKKSWQRLIEEQGFEVTTVIKMPVVSGYGFGFDGLRRVCERIGLSSSYAYIAFKRGMASPYRAYWKG